jgi:hypothetical protein
MNISVTFHISVQTWNTRKVYRILVEHYYSSVQVERFRIKGKNDREILMEKRLTVHKQPWKIIQGNIEVKDIKQAAMAVRDTQDAIDDYLEARKTNPQNEGYVSLDDIRRELAKKLKKW